MSGAASLSSTGDCHDPLRGHFGACAWAWRSRGARLVFTWLARSAASHSRSPATPLLAITTSACPRASGT